MATKKVKIKVCGMKLPQSIAEVGRLRLDYMGFIFWEPSKRFLNHTIPEIPTHIIKTGVFVNASIEEIIEQVLNYNLGAIQLHGAESVSYIKGLRKQLAVVSVEKMTIIKVFSIGINFNFKELVAFQEEADFFLFDTKGKLPGGNGHQFNWNLLSEYKGPIPYFLSGGIGPEDVSEIKTFLNSNAATYCHAIDLNSRFETEPGTKKQKELAAFINEIQNL